MNDRETVLAFQWLKKARNDIITAQQTLLLPDGPTDTVCFHAQQAVEKALKAYLTSLHIPFPKTHDLLHLLNLITDPLGPLGAFRNALAELTDYSVAVRYPDDEFEPSRKEAKNALQTSQDIVALIQEMMQ